MTTERCTVCGEQFSTQNGLYEHLRAHGHDRENAARWSQPIVTTDGLVEELREPGDQRQSRRFGLEWKAADRIASLERALTERDARIAAAIKVIEEGYPGQPAKTEQCKHEKFGFEDCIACYDEALLSALSTTNRLDDE